MLRSAWDNFHHVVNSVSLSVPVLLCFTNNALRHAMTLTFDPFDLERLFGCHVKRTPAKYKGLPAYVGRPLKDKS